MRFAVAMMCFWVSACGQGADAARQSTALLPPFKFRQMTAGVTTLDKAKDHGIVQLCGPKGDAISCLAVRPGYGDLRNGMLEFVFKGGVFSAMRIQIAPEDFDQHVTATEWNYGEPCRKTTSQEGALERAVWCFRKGRLILRRHIEGAGSRGEIRFLAQ